MEPVKEESTPEKVESQANSATKPLLMRANVYAQLNRLGKFDAGLFKRMATVTYPGARKTSEEWAAFKQSYSGSGSTK